MMWSLENLTPNDRVAAWKEFLETASIEKLADAGMEYLAVALNDVAEETDNTNSEIESAMDIFYQIRERAQNWQH